MAHGGLRILLGFLFAFATIRVAAQSSDTALLGRIEHYIDHDIQDSAQTLIYAFAAKAHTQQPPTATDYYVQTRQTEVYYYAGLYQFGMQSGEEALLLAKQLKDSFFLADAYHFLGLINQEMNRPQDALIHFRMALAVIPKYEQPSHYRILATRTHIYHSLSEIFLQQGFRDSALHYARLSLVMAQKEKAVRAEAVAWYFFGEVYKQQLGTDSALNYYRKGIEIAQRAAFRDVELLCIGGIATYHSFRNEFDAADLAIEDGFKLLSGDKPINASFSEWFYNRAAEVYRKSGNADDLIRVLENLRQLHAEQGKVSNQNIQKIAREYSANENKVIALQLEKANHTKQILIYNVTFLALAFASLLMGFGIYRTRKRQELRIAHTRQEISKDLHDDVGSGLSVIRMMSELITTRNNLPEAEMQYARKIVDSSKDIAQRMHAIIWSMNTENDTLVNFIEYTKHFGYSFFENTAIVFHATSAPEPIPAIPLNGLVRKNLFLLLKEAYHNVLKHSNATAVNTTIIWQQQELTIIVKDNGKGYVDENRFGNGLKNMRKRMEAIGGSFSIHNDEGACVSVAFPLNASGTYD